jgi:hypothetical protein
MIVGPLGVLILGPPTSRARLPGQRGEENTQSVERGAKGAGVRNPPVSADLRPARRTEATPVTRTPSTAGTWCGEYSWIKAAESRGWQATVGVQNLSDERYLVQGNASLATLGYAERIYARPRNWFMQLSVDF